MKGNNMNCRNCRLLKQKLEDREREIQELYEQKIEFLKLEQKVESGLKKLQSKSHNLPTPHLEDNL